MPRRSQVQRRQGVHHPGHRRNAYDHAAASSWRSVAKLDAAGVTDVELTAADLEDLTPDPRTRHRVVLEYEQASARRFWRRCPPGWRFAVDRVRYA
ncbi:hypothetical protein [Lentzea jiangxiensis]|uniref:hypothetical protein n=1 Tax=Lentzea jiangxiensis TaxID=641025 RepID=UPI000B7CC92D|nr:hypothetical protein [Lentzea jiangxiensis]